MESLDEIRQSPSDAGTVELIVRRPESGTRELLSEGELDLAAGLVGDYGSPNPEAQLTLMNARAAALVAGGDERERWALAGDQLYVDFDLSKESLPPGTRLEIGSAVIEVTAEPHLGCGKFLKRFGVDAQKLVNSDEGRELNLRGINAKVITPGTLRSGDPIRRIPAVH